MDSGGGGNIGQEILKFTDIFFFFLRILNLNLNLKYDLD